MTSLGILSWHAHETLERTLSSYAALLPLVEERVIWFNEISDEDRALAAKFGFEARGTAANLGIFGGTRALLNSLSGDIVISCQNDNPVAVNPEDLVSRLTESLEAIRSGAAQWVRLRMRRGEGFSDAPKYLRYWGKGIVPCCRRLLRPIKAAHMRGRAVAVEADPSQRFPNLFQKRGSLFLSNSSIIDYSDQPFAASHAFITQVFDWADAHKEGSRTLNGRFVPEIILNRGTWWRQAAFPVAVSDGIFAHARYDDSFRADNKAFNPQCVEKKALEKDEEI